MAQTLGNKKAKPAATAPQVDAAAAAAAAELAVLHPERMITLRDRVVEMRMYGYIEGMRLQPTMQAFLDSLFGLFSRAQDAPPPAEAVRAVFIDHVTTVHWMMAQAMTPAVETFDAPQGFAEAVAENAKWIATLDDIEGDALMSVWWSANGGFFSRRLRERKLAQDEEIRLALGASTPP